MNHSSLFILPESSKFREKLLIIVTTPEDIVLQSKAHAAPDMYGISDIDKSQKFTHVHINEGKILIRDKSKIKTRIFELFIIVVILLSCIMLCIDTPLNNPDSVLSQTLAVIDIIFSIVFLVEAILKILAFGFFWNHYQGVGAYILNAWNVLDFVVVTMSLADIYFSYIVGGSDDAENLSSFKALRAIRALRPLRVISRNESLKIAIQALLASIPAIGNVLIICGLFLLIFGILGVNFFKGAYYHCNLNDESLLGQVQNKDDCVKLNGEWVSYSSNFDNVAIACLTLFEMMTTEGWVGVMSNGVDARGIEKQPKEKNNELMVIYFVIFMILGNFLLINLFTAVITDNFNKIKESKEIGAGAIYSNDSSKEWVDAQNIAVALKPITRPIPPSNRHRLWFYKVVMSKKFDLIVIIAIILNTLVIAMIYARMSKDYELSIEILNYMFVFFYNVEFVMKVIGLGKQYFTHDGWNIFDFI